MNQSEAFDQSDAERAEKAAIAKLVWGDQIEQTKAKYGITDGDEVYHVGLKYADDEGYLCEATEYSTTARPYDGLSPADVYVKASDVNIDGIEDELEFFPTPLYYDHTLFARFKDNHSIQIVGSDRDLIIRRAAAVQAALNQAERLG